MIHPGQIVVFRFPQTDKPEGKLRPALVIDKVPGKYDDWLICMISSQVDRHIEGFDDIIGDDHDDFKQSGLKIASVICPGRLAVVEKRILAGAIGSISSDRLRVLKQRLCQWLGR